MRQVGGARGATYSSGGGGQEMGPRATDGGVCVAGGPSFSNIHEDAPSMLEAGEGEKSVLPPSYQDCTAS